MTKVKLVFALILSLLTTFTQGQNKNITQSVRGIIVDKQSQQTLIGATILVVGSDPIIGTTSDVNGAFKIEGLSLGRHSFQVSYVGYIPQVINNINLTSAKQIVLKVELEESTSQLETVTITAKIDKAQTISKMASVSARTFSVEETERYAGSLGDPARMVSNFAGVSMTNDSRNDIIIRGNSPISLLWRLDGIEIPNPNHFGAAGTTGGPVSMLNNNLLTNSDFFTGAFPAEYGNAISGVFDLKMRSGNNEEREYTGQIGFNGFEFGMEGPFKKGKKGSYLVNYRYSTLGLMNSIGMDFGLGTAIPQYQDLSFKIDLPTNKMGKFSIIGMGGLSYIELHDSDKALANDQEEDANYTYGGVDLDFGSDMAVFAVKNIYFLNKNTHIETILSAQGTRSTTRIDSLKFTDEGELIKNSQYLFYNSMGVESKYSFATHLRKKLDSKNHVSMGIYYDHYVTSLEDSARSYQLNRFIKSFDIQHESIPLYRTYGQWQHRFTDNLTLNTGLYAQYVSFNQEFVLEPRLGLKYSFGSGNQLSLGYGKHSSMLPRLYYFTQILTDSINMIYEVADQDVKMYKSHQFVLAFDKMISSDFRFKTEVYYQSLYDVPVMKSTPEYSLLNSGDSFAPTFASEFSNEGSGTNYGIEFTLEKFLSSGYYFLVTTSLFESKYKGYDGIERNTAFNGNFATNALAGYEFKIGKYNRLTLDLKTAYAGGKRYVPIDLEESIANNYTSYDWDKAYEDKYDNYFRVDVRIGFKMNKKKFSQEWAIDLQNVTDHKNIYSESFSPRTGSILKDYQTGFFPMFLYRIRF